MLINEICKQAPLNSTNSPFLSHANPAKPIQQMPPILSYIDPRAGSKDDRYFCHSSHLSQSYETKKTKGGITSRLPSWSSSGRGWSRLPAVAATSEIFAAWYSAVLVAGTWNGSKVVTSTRNIAEAATAFLGLRGSFASKFCVPVFLSKCQFLVRNENLLGEYLAVGALDTAPVLWFWTFLS